MLGPTQVGSHDREAALRYQHATDERDRVLAAGIDRFIQAAKDDSLGRSVELRRA